MIEKAVKKYDIRSLRIDLKMTQAECAGLVGVGLRTWQRRESSGVGFEEVVLFVNALGGFLPPSEDIFRRGGLFKLSDYEN